MSDDSRDYQRFLRQRGLTQTPERSPVWGILRALDDLDRRIERQEQARRNVASDLDLRRIENRINRFEAEQQRLHGLLDEFAPDHVIAISELRQLSANAPTGGPHLV